MENNEMFFTPMHCPKSIRDAIDPKLKWTKIYIDPTFDLESEIKKANEGKDIEEGDNDDQA